MSLIEELTIKIQELPQEKLVKALHYTEYLLSNNDSNNQIEEKKEWNNYSFAHAMRDSDDEPDIYSLDDLKERWH